MLWTFTQRFSVRASTVLLIYIPLLALIAIFGEETLHSFSEYISLFVFGSLESGPLIALVAAILGFSFFVASLIKRNPQVQFAVEFLLGAVMFIGWPVY